MGLLTEVGWCIYSSVSYAIIASNNTLMMNSKCRLPNGGHIYLGLYVQKVLVVCATCCSLYVDYRKLSKKRRTKYQNLNDSRLVLQLSFPSPLRSGVKSRMKMLLEQRRQAMLQLHLSDQQFYCFLKCILY